MKNDFKGKKIAVLGLGLEGKDVVSYLLSQDAQITIFDQKGKYELDFSGIDVNKVKFVGGKNYLSSGLKSYDIVFRSPGVYRYLPEIVDAEAAGVMISSAIKLFFDLCPAKIIGVTGTKGKGTTATLIYKILKQAKKDTYLAGNIGKPCLKLLPKLSQNTIVVMELSSFQTIDLHKSPHIAVVLNITQDHLDWHKDRREYVEAKKNIVNYQKKKDFSVLNYDYLDPKSFEKATKAKVFYFSKKEEVLGCYVKEGKVFINTGKKEILIGDVNNLLLRGEHNWENVCASVCASYLAKANINSIRREVFKFKGLEHRLELVKKVEGIKFYNDSFATGPQPTIAAIESFSEPVTVILGGYDKGLNYSRLAKVISKSKNVKVIILIGEVADRLKKELKSYRYGERFITLGKPRMKKIVETAFKNTPQGGVVLLSPAAASFDMFENYKVRGWQFKDEVSALKE